ncbi:MAG: MFS transporter [Anaerolineae bacterium]|jgi:DHA3 family macrolide efflux protein-like MFS transporter|nr:MFS transporter [Anaerolineae bacterium]
MKQQPLPTSNATETAPPSNRWAVKFFTLWSGQAISLVGSALVQFALVWWLTSQTGSATVLATASLVALLPNIVLGPFAGALVDRWNRRLIMIFADASIALATFGLLLLFALGKAQPWHVYAIMAIRSLGSAFHAPAMTASTSLMVPQSFLTRLAGMNQTLHGAVNILAPPLGALLLSRLPTTGILAIDIVTAITAIVPLAFIAIPNPPRQVAQADGSQAQTSYWQDLGAGFRYVRHWPGLLGLILLAMMLNFLLVPASSLLPLLITRELRGGPPELAWAETLLGVGTILGGILLSAWGGFRRKIITSLIGVIGLGIGILVTGLLPAQGLRLLYLAYLWIGIASVIANGPLTAIFQSTILPDMQGRVLSLIGAGATAMMPLSLLIAGPLSDALGMRTWYVGGGIACILVTLIAFFIRPIMHIEQNQQQPIATPES